MRPAFGDAAFSGDATSIQLKFNGAMVTPDCAGYWLVASNGNVVAFGDGDEQVKERRAFVSREVGAEGLEPPACWL